MPRGRKKKVQQEPVTKKPEPAEPAKVPEPVKVDPISPETKAEIEAITKLYNERFRKILDEAPKDATPDYLLKKMGNKPTSDW